MEASQVSDRGYFQRKKTSKFEISMALLFAFLIYKISSGGGPRDVMNSMKRVATEVDVKELIQKISPSQSFENLTALWKKGRESLSRGQEPCVGDEEARSRPLAETRASGSGSVSTPNMGPIIQIDQKKWRRESSPRLRPSVQIPTLLREVSLSDVNAISEQEKIMSRRNSVTLEEPRTPSALNKIQENADKVLVNLARFGAQYVDSAFLCLAGSKCLLLATYVLNIDYFFGLKVIILQWASRSYIVRVFLALGLPIANVIVLLTAYAVSFRYPLKKVVGQRWRVLGMINVLLLYVIRRLYDQIRGDAMPVLRVDRDAKIRDMLAFTPPSKTLVKAITKINRMYFPLVMVHKERVPERRSRLLFVGNHSYFALDSPVVMAGIYTELDIYLRTLGEHAWAVMPFFSDALEQLFGVFDGTPRNCDAVMEQGYNMLVYPGGAKEAWKLASDKKYALRWEKKPTGFARMAIKNKYTIICISCIGVEDAVRPVKDIPISEIVRLGGIIPPSKKSTFFRQGAKISFPGINPCNAQRIYLQFAEPLYTEGPNGFTDPDELREAAKKAIETGIEELKIFRRGDPDRYLFRKNPSAEKGTISLDENSKL